MVEEIAMQFVIEMRQALHDGDLDQMQQIMHEYNAQGLLDVCAQLQPDHYETFVKLLNN